MKNNNILFLFPNNKSNCFIFRGEKPSVVLDEGLISNPEASKIADKPTGKKDVKSAEDEYLKIYPEELHEKIKSYKTTLMYSIRWILEKFQSMQSNNEDKSQWLYYEPLIKARIGSMKDKVFNVLDGNLDIDKFQKYRMWDLSQEDLNDVIWLKAFHNWVNKGNAELAYPMRDAIGKEPVEKIVDFKPIFDKYPKRAVLSTKPTKVSRNNAILAAVYYAKYLSTIEVILGVYEIEYGQNDKWLSFRSKVMEVDGPVSHAEVRINEIETEKMTKVCSLPPSPVAEARYVVNKIADLIGFKPYHEILGN